MIDNSEFLAWATAADAAAVARDFAEPPFIDAPRRRAKEAPEYEKGEQVFGLVLDCYAVLEAAGGAPLEDEVLRLIDEYYGSDDKMDAIPGEWRLDKPSKANKQNTAKGLAKDNPEAVIASAVILRDPKGGYSGAVAFRLWDKVKVVPFRPGNYLQGLRRVCQANKGRKIILRHWAGFGVERMKQEGYDARAWKTPDGDARTAADAARRQAGIVKPKKSGWNAARRR